MTAFPPESMIRITEEELKKRIVEWRNLKVLHPKAQAKNHQLKKENRELKGRIQELEAENGQIEKLRLQLEELRAMQFGKRRDNPGPRAKPLPPLPDEADGTAPTKVKRPPASYRRPLPEPESVTDHLRLELPECPACGGPLTDKKDHVHYREDLRAAAELLASARQIVRTVIESGKCAACASRQSAMEIPKQQVIIGENVRAMTVYLTVVQGQSYAEARRALAHQYGIELSSGEIANILEGESILLTPAYNGIAEALEQESQTSGCQYDETGWHTESRGQETSEGNYCWIKIGVKSQNRLIWFGRSRGKGVAEALRGDKAGSLGVSDDYGGYKCLLDAHQLCWAHPHRKLRDLAGSATLTGKPKQACGKAFRAFAKVYQKAQMAREQLLAGAWSEAEKSKQREKLMKQFGELLPETPHDPEKLRAIRKRLQDRQERYFTFFDFPCLPLDNNKAERAIRKIVLKRKKSFGCRSQKGADVLSVLYSVVFTLMESNPDRNFFDLYREAKEEGVSE